MRKLLLLAAFAGLLFLAGRSFHAIALDAEALLPRKEPARIEYEHFLARFDEQRYGYVQVRHPESADVLGISEEISEFLSRLPAVGRVVSPQNARFFLGSEYFSFASLFPKPELGEEARERLRSEVWRRTLFPDAPDRTVILFELAPSPTEAQKKELATLGPFLNELQRRNPGVQAEASGLWLHHGVELLKTGRFLRTSLPALLILITGLLALLFRSPGIVAWGLAALLASAASMSVLLGFVSGGVGPFGSAAMIIALLVSALSAVFFFARFQPAGGRLAQRVALARELAGPPALIFTLGLSAVFLGCLMSRLQPMRELGLACALTAGVQWLIFYRALPFAILEIGLKAPPRRWPFRGGSKPGRKLKGTKRLMLLLPPLALLLLSGLIASRIRPSEAFFSEYVPVSKIDLLLKPRYWDVFDPDNQAELLTLEHRIAELPGVERVASLASFSDDLLSILAMRKPGQGEKLRRELLTTLDEMGALKDFRSPGAKEARSVVWLKPGSGVREVLEGIGSLSRQVQGRITVEIAGEAALRKALATP